MIIPFLNSDDPRMDMPNRTKPQQQPQQDNTSDASPRVPLPMIKKQSIKKKQRGKLLTSSSNKEHQSAPAPQTIGMRLLRACRQRDWKTAEKMIAQQQESGVDLLRLSSSSEEQKTALHYACQYGRDKLVQVLLENIGASKDLHHLEALLMRTVPSQQNWNVLHFACAASASYPSSAIKIVQSILRHAASSSSSILLESLLKAQDDYQSTPLHIATFFESYEITHALLQHSSSSRSSCANLLRVQDVNGDTPLAVAVAGHNPTLVHLLLAHDVRSRMGKAGVLSPQDEQQSDNNWQASTTIVETRGIDGNTALHIACGDFSSCNDNADYSLDDEAPPVIPERLEIVQALLKHPRSSSRNPCLITNDRGETPFAMMVMTKGHENEDAQCSRLSILWEMIRHDPTRIIEHLE